MASGLEHPVMTFDLYDDKAGTIEFGNIENADEFRWFDVNAERDEWRMDYISFVINGSRIIPDEEFYILLGALVPWHDFFTSRRIIEKGRF